VVSMDGRLLAVAGDNSAQLLPAASCSGGGSAELERQNEALADKEQIISLPAAIMARTSDQVHVLDICRAIDCPTPACLAFRAACPFQTPAVAASMPTHEASHILNKACTWRCQDECERTDARLCTTASGCMRPRKPV
jgi:hypothetical protein